MLDVGKPCTHTKAGTPDVPARRVNTVTSAPLLTSVVDRQRNGVAPLCQSVKISTMPPLAGGSSLRVMPVTANLAIRRV